MKETSGLQRKNKKHSCIQISNHKRAVGVRLNNRHKAKPFHHAGYTVHQLACGSFHADIKMNMMKLNLLIPEYFLSERFFHAASYLLRQCNGNHGFFPDALANGIFLLFFKARVKKYPSIADPSYDKRSYKQRVIGGSARIGANDNLVRIVWMEHNVVPYRRTKIIKSEHCSFRVVKNSIMR